MKVCLRSGAMSIGRVSQGEWSVKYKINTLGADVQIEIEARKPSDPEQVEIKRDSFNLGLAV